MFILAIGDFFIPDRAIDLPFKFRKLLNPSYGTSTSNNNKSVQPAHSKIGKVVCLGNIINSNETLKFLYDLSPSFNLVRGEFDDPNIISQQLQNISGKKGNSSCSTIPLYSTISVEGLRIGFTNGYQVLPRNDPLSLSAFAREADVDIVIWGGTHKVEAYTLDGRFFVNPGSATGAYGFDWPDEEEEEEETEETEQTEQTEQTGPKEVEQAEQTEEEPEDDETSSDLNEEGVELTESDMNKLIEMKSSIPSFCLLDIQGITCTLYIYTYLNEGIKVDKVTFEKESK